MLLQESCDASTFWTQILTRLLDDPATRAEWLRLQQRVTLLKQPRQLRQQPRRLPSAESSRESGANKPPNSVTPLHPPLNDTGWAPTSLAGARCEAFRL